MRPQVALPSLLVALLVAALVVVGCGGGGSGSSGESASQLIDQTFKSVNVKSGKLNLSFDADVKGVAQPVAITLTGPFVASTDQTKVPRFDFAAKITSSGKTTQLGAISTGDQGFVMYQGVAFKVPDTLFKQFVASYANVQKQASTNQSKTPSLLSLGIHPRNWIVDPKKAGTAQVGGVTTEHITAGLDTAKLLADVQTAASKTASVAGQSTTLSATDVDALKKSVKSATVDVYTGSDDHRLRRFVVDLQLTTGHVKVLLGFDDLDKPQAIKAPADAHSLSELTGALGGSTDSGSAAGAGSGSAAGSANQQYLTCVQAAGQDVAKLQDCAKFLSGG
jgi:hypothetical protein